jgi:hypothetical protein
MVKVDKSKVKVMNHGPAGFVGLVAFIGAFVYFAQSAHDFVGYFNAFVNALVWPGILVFHVLTMLHA